MQMVDRSGPQFLAHLKFTAYDLIEQIQQILVFADRTAAYSDVIHIYWATLVPVSMLGRVAVLKLKVALYTREAVEHERRSLGSVRRRHPLVAMCVVRVPRGGVLRACRVRRVRCARVRVRVGEGRLRGPEAVREAPWRLPRVREGEFCRAGGVEERLLPRARAAPVRGGCGPAPRGLEARRMCYREVLR
jgi:hypothetical protein